MRLSRHAPLAALALFSACATHQTFTVRVMKPAPVDLGRYRLVAIDRLDGDGCDELTNEITTALKRAQNPLTGKADFEVLDRREFDRMLDDLRRRRTGTSDRETMALLERWKNADVVIRGQVVTHAVTDEVTVQESVDRATKKPRMQFVRTCRAHVVVGLEVVTADREHPVDRVQLDERTEQSTSALDTEPAPIDHGRLLASTRQRVVHRYLERLLPHEESVAVQLQTDKDLPELQAGNGFARTGDWDEAARSYEAAAQRAQADNHWKALYNLGVAHLYANRFEPARKALKDAYSLKQQESILHMLESVTQREGEWRTLQEQSRTGAKPTR